MNARPAPTSGPGGGGSGQIVLPVAPSGCLRWSIPSSPSRRRGSQALWAALQDLAPSLTHPRLVFGRWAFWELAAREFWATRDFEAIERRLSGVVGTYDPVVYLVWGRYQASQGKRVTGGKYLVLSGCAEAEDQPVIEAFIRSCQRMQPHQVWTLLPKAFRSRGARLSCAERVLTDLQAIPGPPWLTRRPTPKYWWEKET